MLNLINLRNLILWVFVFAILSCGSGEEGSEDLEIEISSVNVIKKDNGDDEKILNKKSKKKTVKIDKDPDNILTVTIRIKKGSEKKIYNLKYEVLEEGEHLTFDGEEEIKNLKKGDTCDFTIKPDGAASGPDKKMIVMFSCKNSSNFKDADKVDIIVESV